MKVKLLKKLRKEVECNFYVEKLSAYTTYPTTTVRGVEYSIPGSGLWNLLVPYRLYNAFEHNAIVNYLNHKFGKHLEFIEGGLG